MIKLALKLFWKYALSVLMSFFIFLSCVFIFTSAFSKETGYHVYAINTETGKADQLLYTYEYSSGDDLKLAEYEAQGYTLNKMITRELSTKHRDIAYVVALAFSISLCASVVYITAFQIGNKDISRVHSGFIAEDKIRGIKIGLLAALPNLALYIVLLLSKAEVLKPNFLSVYAMFNSHLYGVIQFIYNGARLTTDLSVSQLILLFVPVLFIPLFTFLGYLLGYKDIRITEKLIYKKENRG